MPPALNQVEFALVEGWNGASADYGPLIRYQFEYMPGELDNGLDDNGNGLVDEGRIVRILDPDGAAQRTVIVTGVREYLEGEIENNADDNGNGLKDEPGFTVQRISWTQLDVMLTIEHIDGTGKRAVRTLSNSVMLRNVEPE